ncbi:MAG: MoaD/ThiS family protein [Leptospira sp.]|nr:MoaD/ThiS family protein [Leptospira sp.]
MEIRLQFFAVLKDHFKNEALLELEKDSRITDLQFKLSRMQPSAEKILSRSMFVMNDSVISPDSKLFHGDFILVLPPVSGG